MGAGLLWMLCLFAKVFGFIIICWLFCVLLSYYICCFAVCSLVGLRCWFGVVDGVGGWCLVIVVCGSCWFAWFPLDLLLD